MKLPRLLLIVYGLVSILVGIYFLTTKGGVSIYLFFNASIILFALLFEKGRYKPKKNEKSSNSEWQLTGERFIDKTSRKHMEVRYNPKTGERDYVEIKEGD